VENDFDFKSGHRLEMNMKIFFFILLIVSTSCTKQNDIHDHLKEIKVGMSEKEVIEIMGIPDDTILFTVDTFRYNFMYKSPFGFSDHFYIYFSKKTKKVESVNNGQ